MPPKASPVRRRPRVASREPEMAPPARSALSLFQKPNLPVLQSTPSSRHQYSYGAAAEPLPSRPSRGLQRGQMLDLSSSVQNALIDHDQDELSDNEPSTSRAHLNSVYPDEDELTHPSEAPSNTEARARDTSSGPGIGGSFVDENRSFAIESDYYGDATIASSTGSLPPHQAIRPLSSTGTALTRLRSRSANILQPHRSQDAPQSHLAELGTRDSFPPATEAHLYTTTAVENQHDATSEDEQHQPLRPMRLQRGRKTNQLGFSASGQASAAPASPPETEDRSRNQSSALAVEEHKPVESPRLDSRGAGESASAASRASEAGPGFHVLGPESNTEPGRWLNGATKASTTSNVFADQPQVPPPLSCHEKYGIENLGPEDKPAIDWWQLLNPWTYVKVTAWILKAAGQQVVDSYTAIFPANFRHFLSATRVGVLIFVLALALLSAGISRFHVDPVNDLWSPVAGGVTWYSRYSPGRIAKKLRLGMPTFSSSRSRWDDINSWEDDPRQSEIGDYLNKIERAFRRLAEAGKLHDAFLEKLEAVVPKVVHMELKDGKPVVAPEFWHALRDLLHEDGYFLTFNRREREYEMSSERQWKAIAARLLGDPAFTKKLNVSIGKVESRLDSRLTLWETWVRENDAKVQQSLGSALDRIKSAESQRERDEPPGKTVKGPVEDRGRFVSRDDYVRLVQGEVVSHLSELWPQLERLVRESVDLAKVDAPPGMSGAEVTALVNGLVRKAFSDINLEALAKGKIHAHWDAELRNQVNYFSPAAGATIDARRSSATYDPQVRPYAALKSQREGVRARLPPMAALQPWHDDGDCWCAARSRNHRGNLHGASLAVLLAYRVVPQHLVVEHIPPGATTEPDARPREIELYAAIDDGVVRERVRDFVAAHLPAAGPGGGGGDDDGWEYAPADLPERFAMIARFVYAGDELHGGVHVHRLSSELVALGAATDHVVVRAVSNHGATNHTCFYRVRLYGLNVELGDGDGAQQGWG